MCNNQSGHDSSAIDLINCAINLSFKNTITYICSNNNIVVFGGKKRSSPVFVRFKITHAVRYVVCTTFHIILNAIFAFF